MPAPELSELFAAIANPPKAQVQPLRLITCVRLGYTTIGTNVPNSGVRGSPGTTGSRGSAALAAKPIKCLLNLNTAAMDTHSTKCDTSMYSFTHPPRAARLWSRHRRECVTNYYTHGACDGAGALADCVSAHWDVAEHHPPTGEGSTTYPQRLCPPITDTFLRRTTSTRRLVQPSRGPRQYVSCSAHRPPRRLPPCSE